MLLVTSCSPGGDLDRPLSRAEKLRQDFGIEAGEAINLPSGSRIVFFGDSITAGGVEEDGYVTLVKDALATLYPQRNIEVLGSGVVGDKVPDLERRLRTDVLARKPTHVVIYVGVNDVASLGPSKAALDEGAEVYREGLAGLVDSIRASGAEVMLCTPAVIGEDVDQGTLINYGLELYAAKVRELTAGQQTGLCDLRSEFTRYLTSRNRSSRRSGTLTVDGLHLNTAGNRLVARTILKAFTGSETLAPTPFIVPTVSPRPQPVRRSPPASIRQSAAAPLSPAAAPIQQEPEDTSPAASAPLPLGEPSASPEAIRTPDGFPLESPSTAPSSSGPDPPT